MVPSEPIVSLLTLHVFPLTVASAAPALSAQDKALLVTALHCAAIGGWVPCADEKSSSWQRRATAASAARPSCVGGRHNWHMLGCSLGICYLLKRRPL